MTLTQRVSEMKKRGLSEMSIEEKLKEEGISPLEINDAMNQSKIKEAVEGEGNFSRQGMVPSIMGEDSGETDEEAYAPSPEPEDSDDYQNYSSQERADPYDSDEETAEEYSSLPEGDVNPYGAPSYAMNSETMIEVAEQVFSEKIKKAEDDLKKLKEFMAISAPAVEDLDERLKRIEKNFDKMQIAILERVGSFGKNIDSLKKEVEMVEDSFEKLNKNKK